ncbi:MAG: 2OG-Fe(II) oxygenase [Bdellovibrionales bacterium]|nr:2OG-Fe(II) oxygenase [Bdellovibrionales bacterium]
MIHDPELNELGIVQKSFPLNDEIISLLRNESWNELDQYFLNAEKPNGILFEFLKNILKFESIEHIIAIRSAPDDEDGIWHDDGSRILGFSLSLTENHEKTMGGELRFRPKNEKKYQSFTTRPMGEMLIFKTGIYGFEHMVSAVTEGKRVVIAGWCS